MAKLCQLLLLITAWCYTAYNWLKQVAGNPVDVKRLSDGLTVAPFEIINWSSVELHLCWRVTLYSHGAFFSKTESEF